MSINRYRSNHLTERSCVLIFMLIGCLITSCQRTQSTKKFVVGFSQCTGRDAWRRQMIISMQGELAFHPDIELVYKDAENSNDRQINDIEDLVKQKVSLLIVSPNEADPITPAVEKAFLSGIPVIIIDRKTNSSLYSAYVGANNFAIGKLAGAYIANLLGGQGKILEIWGRRGSSPAIDRHKGFSNIINEFPGIKVVAEIDGKWELDTAKMELRKSLKSIPDFDLVFAHNDMMAYAASSVCHEILPDKKIKFIGIDALPGSGGGIQFVNDGILTATFLYPTGGEEAIRIAGLILHQRPYEKENILHSTVIDSKNVLVMKLQADKLINQQRDIVRQQEKINEQIQTYYSQRILIYILTGSLIVMIIVGAIAVVSWRAKIEINGRLEAKNNEIIAQRNTIAEMAEKAELATQEKLKFFTNISHEFKTPLTLIMGPIEELLHKGSENKSYGKENLILVYKNAVRLLRLVNQLMDFRKIEEKKMVVRASEADIIKFIVDVMDAFENIAQKRKIDFKLICDNEHLFVWFDPDMLDKVIFNLLSNAFKFTNERGRIYVTVKTDELNGYVIIIIEDNGLGMSAEHANHAFDRFYTGENRGGTGLGLSLSKEFIDLHHGELVLSSEKGKGTRFCISLPQGSTHFSDDQIVSGNEWIRNSNYGILNEEIYSSGKEEKNPDSKNVQSDYTVLLIDDNVELRQFLKNRLTGQYNIVEAQDGIAGLHLAFEVVPDVIICDVMLPRKDGFEVTKELKTDLRTSHIPVIILTAKGSMEQKITGIQTGADEYITKPFAFEYLDERIKALIRNREVLREHYSQNLNLEKQAVGPGSLDKKFINDFTALIEKNISNADLNVNDIGRELGMSRVQVYRKMKALLGYSVNDYIIDVRLKKAQHLLINTDKSIAEISAVVGFSSATYFSTTFKSKFNMSPKEFKATSEFR